MTVATTPARPPVPILAKMKKLQAISPKPRAVSVRGSISSAFMAATFGCSLSGEADRRSSSSLVNPNLASRSRCSSSLEDDDPYNRPVVRCMCSMEDPATMRGGANA